MTAIARALAHDARLLVLDEPTAALTDQESAALLAAVRRLAARGVGVLWVSHRLEEVFDLCDGYSVLRNGELVAEGPVAGATIPQVIAAMAGRSLDAVFPPRAGAVGQPLLTARG
jgi:ABC-type sugar transport system ATPase subunit